VAREFTFDPRRLHVLAFSAAAAQIEGEWAQAELARLGESVITLPGDGVAAPVHWAAQGEQRPQASGGSETWLHLEVHTHVTLQCQRCLQPVTEPLDADRWFRFVATEDEAARLDEDSDDDVLVLSRAFDLRDLAEDELILGLPIVPRHAACPEPLTAGNADEPVEEEAPNPFAALAALRRPPHRS
jgi:uncharacterized protein